MVENELKILCIDDDDDILDFYCRMVKDLGYSPLCFLNAEEAVDAYKINISDIVLVISDYKLSGMTGLDFFKKISTLFENHPPFVIISGYVTKDMALKALDVKVSNFFEKPLVEEQLKELLEKHPERIDHIKECRSLTATFIDEANGIIDDLEPILLAMDNDRNDIAKINHFFRGMHTIKGSSGCLDSKTIGKYVHSYEQIISEIKNNNIEITDAVYDVLLKGFDRIKVLINSVLNKTISTINITDIIQDLEIDLKAQKKPSGKVETKKSEHQPSQAVTAIRESISIPIKTLDELFGYSGEITVVRNMINKIVVSLESQYAGNKDISGLGELIDEMHKINSRIQMRISDLRKVPFSTIIRPINRIIRDLSAALKKKVKMNIRGEKILVDSRIATILNNCLVHLIRNNLDHGIENPQERVSKNKPETGTINISCIEDRELVIVTISDDGRGIDPKKIREKALEKSLYNENELKAMSEGQILSIIFNSGFSTASSVSEISGRGVGMDMVKSEIESIKGKIDINSKLGAGVTFTLSMPIPRSILIIQSLLIEAGGSTFAIPQDCIARIIRIEKSALNNTVHDIANGKVMTFENKLYSLVCLTKLLSDKGENYHDNKDIYEFVLVKIENCHYVLWVDKVIDSEEIVIKPLQNWANNKELFLGATFMEDGTVGLILDIVNIAKFANISSADEKAPAILKEEWLKEKLEEYTDYLLFDFDNKTRYGALLSQVSRIEEISPKQVQKCGEQDVMLYRGQIMPIYAGKNILGLAPKNAALPQKTMSLLVAETSNGFAGIEVENIIDVVSSSSNVNTSIRDHFGIVGNIFVDEHNVTILDLKLLCEKYL